MRKLITTLLAVFVSLAAYAQNDDILPMPKDGLPVGKDSNLSELILNAGFFENGFFWSDLKGHSWWVHENPLLRISDTNLLQVNAYLYDNVRKLALQKGWKVYYSLYEYLDNPDTDDTHPPVFLQQPSIQ